MNKVNTILREVKGKIVTRKELDNLADKYNFDRINLRKLLLNKKYLLTIFRGIYYIKSYDEKKFAAIKYSAYESLAIGLKIKGVKWYFGLNTALKFLNVTHEIFPVNIVINNKFNRSSPMKIMGSDFLFIKIKTSLFYGLKKLTTNNNIALYYSSLEKTLLDFIYLKRAINLKEYKFNKRLLKELLQRYNKNVKKKLPEGII